MSLADKVFDMISAVGIVLLPILFLLAAQLFD